MNRLWRFGEGVSQEEVDREGPLLAEQVNDLRRELVFADGQRERFNFLAAVPPHRPPAVLRGSQLVNEAGWLQVDKHALKTRYDNVYAVGDATMITLANGKPLPTAWLAPIGKDDQFSDWFIGIIGADLDAEVVRAFHAGVHHELH